MVTNWSQNILFSARFQGKSATSSPQKNQSEYRDIQSQFQYLSTTIYKKEKQAKGHRELSSIHEVQTK